MAFRARKFVDDSASREGSASHLLLPVWVNFRVFRFLERLLGIRPFHEVVAGAEAQGLLWPPLLGGLFGGSLDRFKEMAEQYGESLSGLHWS